MAEFDFIGNTPSKPYQGTTATDYIGDFVATAVSGVTELFGQKPSQQVEAFMRENPIGGLTANLGGMLIPYTGVAKVAKLPSMVKKLDKVEDFVKTTSGSAVLGTTARNLATYGSFDVARLGVGLATGDKSSSDQLADVGLSLALEAGGGLVLGALKAAGVRQKHFEELLDKEIDPTAPIQTIARELNAKLPTLAGEGKAKAEVVLDTLLRQIRTQDLPRRGEKLASFVGELEQGGKAQSLNKLFNSSKARRFIEGTTEGKKHFKDTRSWQKVLHDEIGLSGALEPHLKFPRMLYEDGKKLKVEEKVKGNLKLWQGSDVYVGKEKDGLYVVAKKLKDTTWGRGEKEKTVPRWFITKTDKPELFAPRSALFTDTVLEQNAWARLPGKGQINPELTPVLATANDLINNTKYTNYIHATEGASKAKQKETFAKMFPGGLKDNALVAQAKNTFDQYFTPRMFQLRNKPLSRAMLGTMQATYEAAETQAKKLMFGTFKLNTAKSVAGQVATGRLAPSGVSLDSFAKKLNEKDWEDFSRLWLDRADDVAIAEKFAKKQVSKELVNLMAHITKVDNKLNAETALTQKITTIGSFKPEKSHRLLPHLWEGEHRAFIKNDAGQTVWVVGGNDLATVQRRSKIIIDEARKEGKQWRANRVTVADAEHEKEFLAYGYIDGQKVIREDSLLAKRAYEKAIKKTFTPKTFKENKRVGGFESHINYDTFVEVVNKHLKDRTRYLASISTRALLEPHLQKLQAFGDSHALSVVLRRMDDFDMKAGVINQSLNAAADKLLSPVLGKNSATKIASATNKSLMHLTLGAGNVAYSVLSALTFVQTTLPHVAFITSAGARNINKYYSWLPVEQGNKIRGQMGYLDGMKLAKGAWTDMKSPDADLLHALNKAVNDGKIDPSLLEDYIGQTAEKSLDIKRALSSPSGFAEATLKISEFGIAAPERVSRVHSFVMGHKLGKEIIGLSTEKDVYRFASEFTDHTMYRYAAVDRAQVFSGPLGSSMGLFKNWLLHYMWQMGEYSGEAMRGNFKPLLWQAAGTTAVGGVGALPLIGLADKFSKWASDESLMDHIYGSMNIENADGSENTLLSDALYMGLPSMLGISLTSQASSPFANPAHDLNHLMSFVHADRAKAIGQAFSTGVDFSSATGHLNALRDPRTREALVRAVAPKTFYRSMASNWEGTIKSLKTGYPLMQDLGPASVLAYRMGFNPTEVERKFRVAEELWTDREERKRKTQAYGKAWAMALGERDFDQLTEIRNRVALDGLDITSVQRSGLNRAQKNKEDHLERQFSLEDRMKKPALGGGF